MQTAEMKREGLIADIMLAEGVTEARAVEMADEQIANDERRAALILALIQHFKERA